MVRFSFSSFVFLLSLCLRRAPYTPPCISQDVVVVVLVVLALSYVAFLISLALVYKPNSVQTSLIIAFVPPLVPCIILMFVAFMSCSKRTYITNLRILTVDHNPSDQIFGFPHVYLTSIPWSPRLSLHDDGRVLSTIAKHESQVLQIPLDDPCLPALRNLFARNAQIFGNVTTQSFVPPASIYAEVEMSPKEDHPFQIISTQNFNGGSVVVMLVAVLTAFSPMSIMVIKVAMDPYIAVFALVGIALGFVVGITTTGCIMMSATLTIYRDRLEVSGCCNSNVVPLNVPYEGTMVLVSYSPHNNVAMVRLKENPFDVNNF